MLKALDILGYEITFFHHDSKRIKTSFGGIFSLLLLIIFILLVIAFGQDFFHRENPSFIKSSISLDSVPMYSLSNNNFTMAFRIEDYAFNPFNNPEVFEIITIYHIFTYNNQTSGMDEKLIDLPIKPFMKGMLPESFLEVDKYMCPYYNNTLLGGSWTQPEIAYLEVYAKVCVEGKTSSRGLPCATKQEKEDVIKNVMYFKVFYQKALIDASRYSKPIEKSVVMEYFVLDANVHRYYELKFLETIVETDYGWIIKDKKEEKIIGHYTTSFNYYFRTDLLDGGAYYNELGGFGINFMAEKELYKREYPKIQSLAAQVGGILKIFLELGYFLVGKFNLFNLQLLYSNPILDTKSVQEKKENCSSHINKSNLQPDVIFNKYNSKINDGSISKYIINDINANRSADNSKVILNSNAIYLNNKEKKDLRCENINFPDVSNKTIVDNISFSTDVIL